eukprot:CAMPEP_0167780902 /NCGR_PEP_ID=MMETSP0111_2-20121227/5625_1 /TAXON_ID=91324 /ORGANISM="Lotharella globosa, Strain CCCM811" /LENGTH=54 /DNA_ID=CAMNT_0007671485 /DNA_START=278 /DNA_END=442 /DNA_ORIENTATION=-
MAIISSESLTSLSRIPQTLQLHPNFLAGDGVDAKGRGGYIEINPNPLKTTIKEK